MRSLFELGPRQQRLAFFKYVTHRRMGHSPKLDSRNPFARGKGSGILPLTCRVETIPSEGILRLGSPSLRHISLWASQSPGETRTANPWGRGRSD
jgi:hypothetical protein